MTHVTYPTQFSLRIISTTPAVDSILDVRISWFFSQLVTTVTIFKYVVYFIPKYSTPSVLLAGRCRISTMRRMMRLSKNQLDSLLFHSMYRNYGNSKIVSYSNFFHQPGFQIVDSLVSPGPLNDSIITINAIQYTSHPPIVTLHLSPNIFTTSNRINDRYSVGCSISVFVTTSGRGWVQKNALLFVTWPNGCRFLNENLGEGIGTISHWYSRRMNYFIFDSTISCQ